MKTQFITAALLLTTSFALAEPGDFDYVKQLQANIYEQPSGSSKVKFVVAIGRKLVEFQRKGDFVNVGVDKAGGRDGWINASDMSPTDPDGLRY